MKKRRILLGLALAAAAVFSLSACDEDKTTDTPTQQNEDQTTKYTVKFMNGTTEVQNTKVEKDATITAPATNPTKAEDVTATYTFKGWFTAATGGTQLTATTKATADVTYYAQFTATPKQYTITFMNGDATYDTKSLNYDAVVTQPDGTPEKDSDNENNYSFAGWFTAATGGTELTATTKVTGPATYYAQFTATAREYNVIFMNGSTTFDTQSLAYNAQITAPATNPTKAEDEDYTYTFDGWYDQAKGGNKITEFGKVTENPTTFYAQFTKHEKCTIKFISDAVVYASYSLAEGAEITKPETDPTKTEDNIATYTFDGWYTKNGSIDGDWGSEVTEFGTVAGDTTYYAKFNPTVKQYDIKFYNGDTEITALADKIDANTSISKPDEKDLPTQTGKRFDYWTADTQTKIPYNFADKITGAVSLYAVFVDTTDYDTLAADTNNLFGSTFYDASIAAGSTSFNSETITLKSNDADAVTLTANNKVNLASTAGTTFVVDLGNDKITSTGVITLYAEINFAGIANGEAFLQVDGVSATKSNTEIFGIRTKKDERGSTSTTNGKTVFTYRLDGGTEVFSNVEATANTVFKFKIVLDTADGVAYVYINGEKIFEDDTISISKINGLKFTSKSGTAKTVDNVAINYEYKAENAVVAAKKAAIKVADDYIASQNYKDLETAAATSSQSKAIKDLIDETVADYRKEIASLNDVDEINSKKTEFESVVSCDKFASILKAVDATGAEISGIADKYIVVFAIPSQQNAMITSQLTELSYPGYTMVGIYKDTAFTTAAALNDYTENAELYVKLEAKTTETVKFQGVEATGWTKTSSGAAYKTNQADGKSGESGNEPTGTFNAIQLQLKTSESKDGRLTYTFENATKSVDVSMTGWTTGGGSALQYVTVIAYDKDGNVLATKTMYTSTHKQNGDFTVDSDGNNKVLSITTDEDIDHIEFSCNTDGKSYFITSITLDYAL